MSGRGAPGAGASPPSPRAKTATRLTPSEWGRYWQRPTVTTFQAHFPDNYDGEIADFWHGVFARLPAAARIVDLATGNGALLLLARAHAREHGQRFDLTGVDLADIRPRDALRGRLALFEDLGAIRFVGRTPLERTGLPPAGFDAVISQYGFEYAPPDEAAAEAARLLAPGGTLALVIHHAESALVRQAHAGLEQAHHALASQQLLEHAGRMLRRLQRARTPEARQALAADPRAQAEREALNAALRAVSARAAAPDAGGGAGFADFLLRSLRELLERAATLRRAQIIEALGVIERECRDYQRRMADLVDAACDRQDIDALSAALDAAGLTGTGCAELHYRGALMAWTLTAHRPPG